MYNGLAGCMGMLYVTWIRCSLELDSALSIWKNLYEKFLIWCAMFDPLEVCVGLVAFNNVDRHSKKIIHVSLKISF